MLFLTSMEDASLLVALAFWQDLSDPASVTGSDRFWCAVGFIVGAILLALGIFKSA